MTLAAKTPLFTSPTTLSYGGLPNNETSKCVEYDSRNTKFFLFIDIWPSRTINQSEIPLRLVANRPKLRKPKFFLFNYIQPSVLINLLALFVFLIPAESGGRNTSLIIDSSLNFGLCSLLRREDHAWNLNNAEHDHLLDDSETCINFNFILKRLNLCWLSSWRNCRFEVEVEVDV